MTVPNIAYELAGEFAYLNFPDEIRKMNHRDTEDTENAEEESTAGGAEETASDTDSH